MKNKQGLPVNKSNIWVLHGPFAAPALTTHKNIYK